MSASSDDDAGADEGVGFLDRCHVPGLKSHSAVECSETEDSDDVNCDGYIMGQYAQGVIDFSSQYGSDYSISYTAPNITGKPRKYPDYGDFAETFAMRTYGDWWNKTPSSVKEIQPQNLQTVPVDDFIVVYFENYVFPKRLFIFETYNPGAIVRIWAYTIAKTWFLLWENKEFGPRSQYSDKIARQFAPPLNKSSLPTKTIRLEFNHRYLNYFAEIDAVLLCGRNVNNRTSDQLYKHFERQKNGSIIKKLKTMQFRPKFETNYKQSLQEFLANDLERFVSDMAIFERPHVPTETGSTQTIVGLKDMPFEIMLKIFGHLDLVSLFNVGQVSRFFYDVSKHPLLYSEINLKPYWHLANTNLLCTLARRATVLKKLDLSWCGLYSSISPTEFKKFIQQRGDTMTHLRLNSCKFLNASCVETLGIVCDNLKELSLRNLSTEPPILNFSHLCNLKNLERLDLFQTVIEPYLLLTMLENNRKLKHLNLAFSGITINMDNVAAHIGTYNTQLISLDMWKSHFFTTTGLLSLSNCHNLEEVDFGWCLREVSIADALRQLLINCPKIKKLFLAAVRGLTDRDLENIANYCENLEQLDLMGVLGISKDRYFEILTKCKNLQLLDLSFCDNVDENEVAEWSRSFSVDIKSGHVPADLRL